MKEYIETKLSRAKKRVAAKKRRDQPKKKTTRQSGSEKKEIFEYQPEKQKRGKKTDKKRKGEVGKKAVPNLGSGKRDKERPRVKYHRSPRH